MALATDLKAHRGKPLSSLSVGIPKESWKGERRVAATPETVASLLKAGYKGVLVESDAGAASSMPDELYKAAGATIVGKAEAFASDIVLKVRSPSIETEVSLLQDHGTLISFVQPATNPKLLDALAKKKSNVLGMVSLQVNQAAPLPPLPTLQPCYVDPMILSDLSSAGLHPSY